MRKKKFLKIFNSSKNQVYKLIKPTFINLIFDKYLCNRKNLYKVKKREITRVRFMELLGHKKNHSYKILKEYEVNKLQPK